jgi:isochorismate synthase
MQKHLAMDFLQTNLAASAEFSLVALPSDASGERKFHHFSEREQQGLVDANGNKLTLQPFPDGERHATAESLDTKALYLSMARKAISSMQAKEMEKVVLARTKTVDHVAKESLNGWYERLLEAYPKALVFAVSTEESGLWIGATPEMLVEKTGTSYRTLALAATHMSPDLPWTQKEYDEHEHVASYLVRELTLPEIENLRLTGPYETGYGNLSHLRTDVSFASSLSLRALVAQLHPTPALCGYPKQEALQFIQENEAQPRSYYTGSMVIESPEGDGVAYAFLRCGRLADNGHLTIYAGCGVVAASTPEQEWAESEAKANSVLSFL